MGDPIGDTTEVISKDRVAVTPPRAEARAAHITQESARTPGPAPQPRGAIALRDVRNNEKIRAFIDKANEQMAVIGYSEHGLRHAALVAAIARNICLELDLDARTAELAAIAGYLHDIGNCVHRIYHPQIGATMAFQLLDAMGMAAVEVAWIIGAIGNHEEPEGVPINAITAAVIIADKSDVHFTRVQNPDPATYDIHDRVNHAVQKSRLLIDRQHMNLTLDLITDASEASVISGASGISTCIRPMSLPF